MPETEGCACFFFFQAEDGIRDLTVTGVQTCALPILQGKDRQSPPYEKVLAHFLRKRRVKRATVPANFALSYAHELARDDVALTLTNGLFWPEREAKTDEEIKLIGRALRITEIGMERAM